GIGTGVYVATLSGTLANVYTVTPQFDTKPVGSLNASVTLTAGKVDSSNSTFVANPTSILANNSDYSTLTFTAKDSFGNPVTGISRDKLLFVPNLKNSNKLVDTTMVTLTAITEKGTGSGVYEAKFMGTFVSVYSIAPLIDNSPVGSLKAEVELKDIVPVEAQSSIKTDKTSYESGTDLKVTVTLKNSAGNVVSGQSALLNNRAVEVENAKEKDTSWVEVGNGTYTRTYTAWNVGTDLYATLKINSWSKKSEKSYVITSGAPDISQSTVRTSGTQYKVGGDVRVIVQLKDKAGNNVNDALYNDKFRTSTVIIPNLKEKEPAAVWEADSINQAGSYHHDYLSDKVGSGLKVKFKLAEWNDYITQTDSYLIYGKPNNDKSSISTNTDKYFVGEVITVTATVKDENGSPITGLDRTKLPWSIPNAQTNTGDWVDKNNGTYERTFIATDNGTNLRIAMKLEDSWSADVYSNEYNIYSSGAYPNNSTITTDKKNYQDNMNVIFYLRLKDAKGQPVSGKAQELNNSATFDVPGCTKNGDWTESETEPGLYTIYYFNEYRFGAAGDQRATLKMPGWSNSVQSTVYHLQKGGAGPIGPVH
ncbi:Ig-like domain-containing protein, partial [uncultured Bartonella sp.]|uniref:Ig-like domain-containing protein n=1 Tax=uncultured Bartonella sp. TaxID=104108 RepID=UPI00261C3ACD